MRGRGTGRQQGQLGWIEKKRKEKKKGGAKMGGLKIEGVGNSQLLKVRAGDDSGIQV